MYIVIESIRDEDSTPMVSCMVKLEEKILRRANKGDDIQIIDISDHNKILEYNDYRWFEVQKVD